MPVWDFGPLPGWGGERRISAPQERCAGDGYADAEPRERINVAQFIDDVQAATVLEAAARNLEFIVARRSIPIWSSKPTDQSSRPRW